MADKALPPPEVLRQLLRYEPETGKLFWRRRGPEWFPSQGTMKSFNTQHAGKEAFTSVSDGYRTSSIAYMGRAFSLRAHRVIWAIVHKSWPSGEIDHINGVRDDNRIENLRVVSLRENCRNQRLRKTNTSGVAGVCWDKRDMKWRSRICADGRYISLGNFSRLEDAAKARAKAEVRYGYHPNHGRAL
ncbi:MAG: HNH endonuclease [Novosphingobium sp.]|nr:HNH endonuclease [Novosphingobium sp.]